MAVHGGSCGEVAHSASSSSVTRRNSANLPGVSRVTTARGRCGLVVGRAVVGHEVDRSGAHGATADAVLAGLGSRGRPSRYAAHVGDGPARTADRDHRRCPWPRRPAARRKPLPDGDRPAVRRRRRGPAPWTSRWTDPRIEQSLLTVFSRASDRLGCPSPIRSGDGRSPTNPYRLLVARGLSRLRSRSAAAASV